MNAGFTALGIDIGGTKIAGGVVSFPDGHVQLRRQIATEPGRGGEAVLRQVIDFAGELAAQTRARGLSVDALGVGICELVNVAREIASANCIAWQGLKVKEQLSTIAPAVIEADVRAAALAEALFGAGKPFRIFLYVTVGTGIASCLVLEGRPFLGARGATGTVASSPLPRIAKSWYAAPEMTVEEIASGPALVARFNQLGGCAQSGEEVLTQAKAGNSAALSVVLSAGDVLGATIGWLVNVLDPEAVIIGGGLGLSEGPFWESLQASARRHIWSDLHRELPIVRAATGPDAGVIGAAAAAWKEFR